MFCATLILNQSGPSLPMLEAIIATVASVTRCCPTTSRFYNLTPGITTNTSSTHDQWCYWPLPHLSVKDLLEHTSRVNSYGQTLHHHRCTERQRLSLRLEWDLHFKNCHKSTTAI
jgi:hypothetical protein